jgi:hypothetical protein
VDGAVAAGGAVDDDDLGKLLREFFSLYALSKMSPVAAKMSPVGDAFPTRWHSHRSEGVVNGPNL